MNIKNKAYALDTEGSSGLGLAFVHQMVDKGYTICIVSKEKLPVL